MPTLVGGSEKRDGSGRLNTKQGRPVYEETFSYLVQADNLDQTRLDILTGTSGLPIAGLTIGPTGYTLCKSANATRRPNASLYWDVTADFSSEVDEGAGENDPTVDPVNWIPVYETKWEPLQEIVTKDLDGKAIANTIGQPYETGLTITRKIPVWEFYQFEPAAITDETMIDRHETINSVIFKGRAAETLLLNVLSSVVGYYYGQRRRLTQYQLKYNKKKWTHKRLNAGTKYIDALGKQKAYIAKDLNGNDYPVYGALLENSTPAGGYDADGYPEDNRNLAFINEFQIYDQSNFNFLRV